VGQLTVGQKGAHKHFVAAAESVTFWQTMSEYNITKGVASCNWTLRTRLSELVLSVPAKRVVAIH
jgi:hypothetical protein